MLDKLRRFCELHPKDARQTLQFGCVRLDAYRRGRIIPFPEKGRCKARDDHKYKNNKRQYYKDYCAHLHDRVLMHCLVISARCGAGV
jgi:hypothetical protein